MVWLSDWLSDIIAVILLAVLVELLLPNKAMQRYARLVIGLLILLTILSPILRLFQADMSARLDAGMEIWNEQAMEKDIKMPSLEEIQSRANEIRDKRNQEAARITKLTLEEAMQKEIEQQTENKVESINVELVWKKQGQGEPTPDIGAITVTLKAPVPSGSVEQGETSIKAVAPVAVNIEINSIEVGSTTKSEPEKQAEEQGYILVNKAETIAIQGVLAQGWGVHKKNILIRQRTDQSVPK
ncbi:stage III sporulation protein AF [Paenibacillus sp. GSMTC-2017]|uniref:stage III sporulation protein AF n=1 Tax=Paenibacillus sp. GSMTC-2017 TaxID=2794350 RepID=UPI001E3D71DC|nr:stage III sporulation protein AF [Paenibacillus sp. GSMTC-2017]